MKRLYILLVVAIAIGLSSCFGHRETHTFEIAEASQTGNACILVFEDYGYAFNVQVQNNTDEEIHRVDFRVIYYAEDGHQMDYHDASEPCSIDAHMTRTIEVRKGIDYPRHYGKAVIQITDYSNLSPLPF